MRSVVAGLALLMTVSACGGDTEEASDSAFEGVASAEDLLDHDAVKDLPTSEPDAVVKYGSAEAQVGELRLPNGTGPFPVAVVYHGGCWTKSIGAGPRYMAPLADALTQAGIATWNVGYRQMGEDGAGWPGTFLDWGRAVDSLRVLAREHPLDLDRVTTIGHSAGAHAALFTAARSTLPDDSEVRGPNPLPVRAVIAIDGPADLVRGRAAAEDVCELDGIAAVMGGTPDEVRSRYAQASPIARIPFGIPQVVVASEVMPADQGYSYSQEARAAGDDVTLMTFDDAGHFNMIAPGTKAFARVFPQFVDTIKRP
ncbi:MAG: alpha/beta hydrolase [Pacificimonas sp.]